MTHRRTVPTQSHSSQGFISDPISGAPSDVDLMQSMLSRIALLEKHCQLQAKQIHDKVRHFSEPIKGCQRQGSESDKFDDMI